MSDTRDYEKIKARAKTLYEVTDRICCPALGAEVSLQAQGFKHLIYGSKRAERDRRVQIARFNLLPEALHLIEITTTHQEYEERVQRVGTMDHKQRKKESRVIKFLGIIAIINGRKIKVVIKQIGNSTQKQFWSIIPAWVTSKQRDAKLFSTPR